jgi:hypothetical protein
MMNVGAFEDCSVTEERRLLVTGIHSQTLGWDLFTIHGETDMKNVVGIGRRRAQKFLVLDHRWGSQDGIIY